MVTMSDYEDLDGFGVMSGEELDDLNKALTAGDSVNPPASLTPGDAFALRMESLEDTLHVITYEMEHLRLYKSLIAQPAYNTVEEYNRLHAYGNNPDAGWIEDGDLPEEDDSTYERVHVKVKFLATTRSVKHAATLINTAHGPAIGQETANGTMHLLRMLERGLFYGDSNLSALQFDGFRRMILDNSNADNIIDMRGKPLSQDVLEDACLTISDAPNYGRATNFHCNPKVIADLAKTFFPKERHDTHSNEPNVSWGRTIGGWVSQSGPVQFEPNPFIWVGGAPVAAAQGDASKIPGTPTISTALAASVDAASQFTASDAGSYTYSVKACNRYGKSAVVSLGAALAIAAGQKATVGMTPAGAQAVDWYELYRSKPGATALSLIDRIPNAAGVGEQVLTDLNANLPFTSDGFLFQQNNQGMGLKQLAPMMKVPLAVINLRIRWIQLIYCVPELYAPNRHVLFRNIGRAANYVGAP